MGLERLLEGPWCFPFFLKDGQSHSQSLWDTFGNQLRKTITVVGFNNNNHNPVKMSICWSLRDYSSVKFFDHW